MNVCFCFQLFGLDPIQVYICIKVVTHFVILHCRLMFLLFYITGRITLIKQKYRGPNTGQLH